MADVQEITQQTHGVENYESKFVDITDGLNNLLNESVDDDSGAKEKIGGALDDGFIQWIKNNPEKAQNLKLLVEKFVEEINKSDSALKREDFSNFLDFAKNVLGVEVDMSAGPDIVPSNLPELILNGTLENLEEDGNNLYLYGLVKEKPVIQDGSQDTTPEEKRFYEVVDRVKVQLQDVSVLLGDNLLSNNTNLKSLNDLLGKIQVVLGNTSKNNVKLLQKYIFDNLDGDEKSVFGSKNHQETGFDGKFGVSTLKGLNLILDKIGNHIEELKKWVENQGVQVSQDGTGEGNGSQMSQEGGSEGNGSQVLQEGDGQGSSPVEGSGGESSETVAYPTDTTPLTIGDSSYGVMNVGTTCDGATFYSTQCLGGGQSVDSEGVFVDVPAGVEYECYLKLNDKPGNLYKVKIDPSGYLCPIASEIDTTTIGKNGDYITNNILFKNNDSCIKYLENKLPSGLNCEIYWDPECEDYRIKSYGGKSLTIEPMTVGGGWVSQDLTECLALLNFTNYLRSGTNENYRGDEPDLKLKKDSLFVELKGGGWGEISQDFLASLGLGNISKDVWKRFIDYNNSEGWKKGSDGLKNNQYKKIDFPSVMVVANQQQQSGQEDGLDNPDGTVDNPDGTVDNPDGTVDNPDGTVDNPDGTVDNPDGTVDNPDGAVDNPDGTVDNPDGAVDNPDGGNDVVNGSNIIDISDLLRFNSESYKFEIEDFNAMQEFLGDDKKFIERNGDTITCDLFKVSSYLESIRDNDWSYFNSLKGGERVAWITAVQILLNEWRKTKNFGLIAITGRLLDGPYGNDTFAYSTKGNLAMFQNAVELTPDGKPGRDTITKLLDCTAGEYIALNQGENGDAVGQIDDSSHRSSDVGSDGVEQQTSGNEGSEAVSNSVIIEGIDNLNITAPILDLSKLTVLSDSDVSQIFDGFADKIGDKTLSIPPTIRLDGLTSLDKSVAEKLSDWKGGISISGIVSRIDFNNCDSDIDLLNTLAPEGKEVKILVFDADAGGKLIEKGVKNIEIMKS